MIYLVLSVFNVTVGFAIGWILGELRGRSAGLEEARRLLIAQGEQERRP